MEKTTTAACDGGGDDPYPFFLLLPEDFLIEILVRLPAVSLLRFKSVCKSWCALIKTSFFIDIHTDTTTFNSYSSKFDTFILRTDHYSSEHANEILMLSSEYGSECKYGDGYRCTDGSLCGDGVGGYWLWDNTNCGWYWVSSGGGDWHWDDTNFGWYWVSDGRDWLWDDTNRSWYWVGDDDKDDQEVFKADDDDDKDDQEVFKADDDDAQLLLKVDKLELPSSYNLTYSKDIAGSCNGLICLYDSKLRDVSLWNPATRQFRTLPKSITIDDFVQHYMDFVAFGFDVKTKDYKVLLITCFCSMNEPEWPYCPPKFCRVQVYSLNTDSWRLLEGINSPLALPPAEDYGLYLSGSCFFTAIVYNPESSTYNTFINSFDFTNELFTTMQLPPDHDHRQNLFLRCLGGEKMALCDYEDCDIWVLNQQHGGCGGGNGVNKEYLTKLQSFQIKNNSYWEPIGISNNGKFALLAYGSSMRLYNLVTKEVKLDIPISLTSGTLWFHTHHSMHPTPWDRANI